MEVFETSVKWNGQNTNSKYDDNDIRHVDPHWKGQERNEEGKASCFLWMMRFL